MVILSRLEKIKQYLADVRKRAPLNFTIPLVIGLLGLATIFRKRFGL